MVPAALWGLLACVAIALPTWAASARLRDASLADRIWPLMIAAAGCCFVAALGGGTRAVAMLAITLAWALRLAIHITRRNRGHGEDRRYAAMRQEHGDRFALRSLVTVFGLQALLAWLVSWPLLAGAAGARPLGFLDAAGAALAIFGVAFEAVADAQLARFKADPANRGAVMDRGLWGWSRHPNYFGECCVWWGLGCMAFAAAGAAWPLLSPVLMTVLLLRVSGVTLLEKDIGERRPGYREYVLRTSAFVPRPPRGSARP